MLADFFQLALNSDPVAVTDELLQLNNLAFRIA